jgi:hypothetical protein
MAKRKTTSILYLKSPCRAAVRRLSKRKKKHEAAESRQSANLSLLDSSSRCVLVAFRAAPCIVLGHETSISLHSPLPSLHFGFRLRELGETNRTKIGSMLDSIRTRNSVEERIGEWEK